MSRVACRMSAAAETRAAHPIALGWAPKWQCHHKSADSVGIQSLQMLAFYTRLDGVHGAHSRAGLRTGPILRRNRLLEEQRAPTFASTEQASGPIAGWYPTLPAKAIPSVRSWAWVAPVMLGVCFALAAALLVVVELGQPPRTPEFRGIRFSNTVNSPGSRAIVQMYREHMGWLPRPYSGETLDSSWYVRGLVTGWGSMVALQ